MIGGIKKIAGVTLLEVLLVLIIMAAILYFSIAQYQVFRHDEDVAVVQANVDKLFDAMTKYYLANCNDSKKATKIFSTYNSSQIYVVDISTLMTNKYLSAPGSTMPISSIVNSTGTGQGYILQFNQFQNSGTPKLPQRTTYAASGTSLGSIVIWQIQVSVEMSDPTNAAVYQGLLGADCVSDMQNGSVLPCEKAGSKGKYLVWERNPSFSTSRSPSTYWPSKPNVKQFYQMYHTDPISYLMTGTSDTQYYACGGGG